MIQDQILTFPYIHWCFILMSIDIPAFLKAFANFKSLNPNPEIRPRGQLT